jgi:transcription initiation factor TFIIIB Brf1 subunit/transcription initiation factor TFIIB
VLIVKEVKESGPMLTQLPGPCVRCHSIDVVIEASVGDIVCRKCGEVQYGRIMDPGAEWREFAEDDRSRSGSLSRSSCSDDRFGSTSTYFIGGVSEREIRSLEKSQLLTIDPREIKMSKTADLIANIGVRLNLPGRVLVSLLVPFHIL